MKREAFDSIALEAKSERVCAHPDCDGTGRFRAPVSRHGPRAYHWFCLEHVREYNSSWDYCAGMSEQELEAEIRKDTVWRRPSWPLGTLGGAAAPDWDEVEKRAAAAGGRPRGAGRRSGWTASLTSDERQAYATLGLEPPTSQKELRQRYKMLAKSLHPDANGGDRKAEERLKSVNHAYATLRCGSRTG